MSSGQRMAFPQSQTICAFLNQFELDVGGVDTRGDVDDRTAKELAQTEKKKHQKRHWHRMATAES
jgi:hypothetical protein